MDRDDGRDESEREKRGDAREHQAQASLGAVSGGRAGVEERALGRVQLRLVR